MSALDTGETPSASGRQYRAPALEKGLDILEVMASADGPLTLSAVSARLSRSVNEVFRMFQVLVDRGYLTMAPEGNGFELSTKMLTLARNAHGFQEVVRRALPHMTDLSQRSGHACYLSVLAGHDLVVIASADAPGDFNLGARPGFRSHIASSGAGALFFGLAPVDVRERLSPMLREFGRASAWTDFCQTAENARIDGHSVSPSDVVPGVTDLSGPVFDRNGLKGILTMPVLQSRAGPPARDALDLLVAACRTISGALGGSFASAAERSRSAQRPRLTIVNSAATGDRRLRL